MNFNEQSELCMMALAHLIHEELTNSVKPKNSIEIVETFPINVVLNKLERCKINVIIPDMLLLIFDICSSGNPGIIQLMTKELLMSVKASYGTIPEAYIVTAKDFATVYEKFPLLENPEIEEKYRLLWDAQKKERKTNFESDNQCDTLEYWQEVL